MREKYDVHVSSRAMHASIWICANHYEISLRICSWQHHPQTLDDILSDYESHLVLEEYRKMLTTSQWSYVGNYMTWFYSVTYPIMTPYTNGHPPKPTHEEILENEQVRDDHVIDVFPIFQNITRLTYEGI